MPRSRSWADLGGVQGSDEGSGAGPGKHRRAQSDPLHCREYTDMGGAAYRAAAQGEADPIGLAVGGGGSTVGPGCLPAVCRSRSLGPAGSISAMSRVESDGLSYA